MVDSSAIIHSTDTLPQIPRLSENEVDFGKLKGNGSFCNVLEVKPSMSSLSSFGKMSNIISGGTSNSNFNASWDFTPKPDTNLDTITKDMDNLFTASGNSNNFSKLSSKMSGSASKLRNLIVNMSNYHNRLQAREKILVAKVPRRNENVLAYEENVRNLKLEAKVNYR